MENAYDRFKWELLLGTMEHMGTNLYFSVNMNEENVSDIGNACDIQILRDPDKDLGQPTKWGKLGKETSGYLKSRIM